MANLDKQICGPTLAASDFIAREFMDSRGRYRDGISPGFIISRDSHLVPVPIPGGQISTQRFLLEED